MLRSLLNPEYESVTADDTTINNSVTYPDGTKVTTSPSGGATEPLDSQSPSGVASVDLTNGIDSTYNRYLVSFTLVPAKDNVTLRARVSTDGGSTFESGTTDYHTSFQGAADGAATSGGTETDRLILTQGGSEIGSGSGEFVGGNLTLFKPADSSLYTIIQGTLGYIRSDDLFVTAHGGGAYTTAESVDGFQLLFSDGSNIESGDVQLMGVE